MQRLLQGDVGSGKTAVVFAAALLIARAGGQSLLMAPTEVLAEQHAVAVRQLLGALDVRVELLTSRVKGKARAQMLSDLARGEVSIVVGTHALLTEEVEFSSLGMVVIDEQHRFGVEQRAALREKGPAAGGDEPGSRHPDVLVMTATPIPRTAAMTVYGDLDQTVLDELPVGRTPVATVWLNGREEYPVAWELVRKEISAGRQAYVICPLVGGGQPEDEEPEVLEAEEAELDYDAPDEDDLAQVMISRLPLTGLDLDAESVPKPLPKSAVEEFARLCSSELTGFRVGLLHGQLPSKEKEATMAAFRRGELQVLVATTVIEVGVDVVNATVMVIEDADRFGIAQLHQLRGRVGRGTDKSWCYLLAEAVTDGAARRLRALEESSDGFELAEVDHDLSVPRPTLPRS